MSHAAIGASKYGDTQPIGKRGLAANSGLTLIEVLIAMVVLLIGIYAVLKIFPAGFGIIEASRQRSVANSLAQAELERCKLLGENLYSLPEAIVATKYDGTAITDYDPRGVIPVQTDYFNSAVSQPLWQPDSVYLPRTIIGERTLIPAVSGGIGVPFYFLQFAPLDYLEKSPDVLLRVYDANPFVRVTSSPGDRQYQIDYSGGRFTFNAANDNLLVTYSWIDASTGRIYTVIGQSVTVTDSGGVWPSPGDPALPPIVPGSEKVYLRYLESGSNPPPQGEFYLDSTSLMTGAIWFSPSDIGKAIGINYRVADWGILREDYEIPASTTATTLQVAALGGIKGPGYTNAPRQTAAQKLPDGTNFVLAADLSDGTIYGDDAGNPAAQKLTVNYRTGAIQFPADNTKARTVRIYYRGVRDWMVQVQKAAAGYALIPTGATPGYDSFTWAGGKTLKFAQSEAGKTVALSYYRDVDVDENGSYADTGDILRQYVTDELVNIATDGTATFCQKDNNYVRPSAYNSFTARGVSLTARAVWVGSGRSIVPLNRTFSGRQEYLNEVWLQSRVSALLTNY